MIVYNFRPMTDLMRFFEKREKPDKYRLTVEVAGRKFQQAEGNVYTAWKYIHEHINTMSRSDMIAALERKGITVNTSKKQYSIYVKKHDIPIKDRIY